MTPDFLVIRDTTPAAAIPNGTVVAMGNFDGVHLGHRARDRGGAADGTRAWPPCAGGNLRASSAQLFQPEYPSIRLTDEAGKLRLLAGTGLAGAVIMTFDKNRAGTTAQHFIHHDLIERLGISGIAVGYDFHFGKGRVGSPSLLVSEAPRLGIEVDVQAHIDIAERPVSSSAIRMALAEGQIEDATAMLGGPWFVNGEVIHGEKRGRDLGYPTANIRLDKNCGLKHGIYAVRGRPGFGTFRRRRQFRPPPDLRQWRAAARSLLFDFKGDLYGNRLDIAFIGFIRDELKFDGIDALIRQMDDDSARARALLPPRPMPSRNWAIFLRRPEDQAPRMGLREALKQASGLCDPAPDCYGSGMFARRTISISGPASA